MKVALCLILVASIAMTNAFPQSSAKNALSPLKLSSLKGFTIESVEHNRKEKYFSMRLRAPGRNEAAAKKVLDELRRDLVGFKVRKYATKYFWYSLNATVDKLRVSYFVALSVDDKSNDPDFSNNSKGIPRVIVHISSATD